MKAVVTGGAGFIGSYVVEKFLEKNIDVVVLDNFSNGRSKNLENVDDQIQIVECDLGVEGDWIQYFEDTDWVIHLAALADIVPSIQHPKAYFCSNVYGTLNVLQAAKANRVKRFSV